MYYIRALHFVIKYLKLAAINIYRNNYNTFTMEIYILYKYLRGYEYDYRDTHDVKEKVELLT